MSLDDDAPQDYLIARTRLVCKLDLTGVVFYRESIFDHREDRPGMGPGWVIKLSPSKSSSRKNPNWKGIYFVPDDMSIQPVKL